MIKREIFREYDIRGVYPDDLDGDFAYILGKGFGTYIQNLNMNKCIIGHDNRLSSPMLSQNLINGILSTGCNVVDLGLCTTPMYYYAHIKLDIVPGIMVTASHNPKDDNGFKIAFNRVGNAKGKEITDFYDFLVKGAFKSGNGFLETYAIENDYIALFKKSLSFGKRKVRVVMDCGNGTTSIIARKLYRLFPMELIPLFDESDGTFPNHHPDPSVEENLTILKEKVLEEKADLGVSFDGDGDRVGLIDELGHFVPADQIMIMIIRDIINKVDKKEFLVDIKCSKAVDDVIKRMGGKTFVSRTGNSYTKAGVNTNNLPFGGELSGHLYFKDRFLGFDSGLYAGLRIIELLSKTDKSISDLLSDIPKYYSTPEIKVLSNDKIKQEVVEKVKKYCQEKKYSTLEIDGVKVLFDDGWALIRVSNTGPNLTLRFEATTPEKLDALKSEFLQLVNSYNKTVH